MACWNDKREGTLLIECPICGAKLAKKRRTYHLTECYDKYKGSSDGDQGLIGTMGLITCPLNRLHVVPLVHLNHHLEGNCEEAQNALRRYFHRAELRTEMRDPPEQFLADIPEKYLNNHNKKLLYLLRKDFNGRDIHDNKDLYPDPPGPEAAATPPTTPTSTPEPQTEPPLSSAESESQPAAPGVQ